MGIVKSIPISQFKAKALQFIEDVRLLKGEYVITKRGEEVARVVPIGGDSGIAKMGQLKGTASESTDIVGPLDHNMWEVLK
jgi:prevent-host-death family protein